MPKYTLNRAKKRCCQWQGERIREEERRSYAPSKTFFQFTTLNSRFSWSTSHVFNELYDQRMRNKNPRADLRRDHHHHHHQGQRTREWILKKSRLPFKSSSFSVQANAPTTLVSVLLAAFLFLPVIRIFASRHASRTESLMSYVGIEKVEAGSLTCCEDLNNATIRIEWRGSNVLKVPYVGLVKCLL